MKFHFHPLLKRFKRRTAVILPKDIGTIIALTGLSKEDVVVEVGGGSGFLSFYLARIVKELFVYERREDIFEVLKENLSLFENVHVINKDGREAKEQAYLYILDTPDFKEVIENIKDRTKWVVVYLPHANQAKEAFLLLKDLGFKGFVVRTILEEWEMDDKLLRPKHKQLIHTAFLVFGERQD